MFERNNTKTIKIYQNIAKDAISNGELNPI
jgi:hypothetical protein